MSATMLGCGAALPAHALDIDLGKYTCAEFLKGDHPDFNELLVWIDGYVAGRSKAAQRANAEIYRQLNRLGDFCERNRDKTLLDYVNAYTFSE